MSDTLFETERLVLRKWRDEDLEPFHGLSSDPVVMRFFPQVATMEKCAALVVWARTHFEEHGYSIGPVVLRETGKMIGFAGLSIPRFEAPVPFEPCVEIGWRLKQSAWGKGYAPEAAGAWLKFGFKEVGLTEIVSFTVPANAPSLRVMEKLGMSHDPQDDFLHPNICPDDPFAPHVLYRLSADQWRHMKGPG